MKYYSTRDNNISVSFAHAALKGLAPDGGLYIPEELPAYPRGFTQGGQARAYTEVAFETIAPFVAGEIPQPVLQDLVEDAYPFDAVVVPIGDYFVCELFHGPTAAFKDFGARFMARAFSWLRRAETKPLHILVATSGDTGGAVADGFYGVEGINVTVLYPKGRVSPLQEKQIAGLGGNVSAIAVEGSFDDCQALVKAAFTDKDINERLVLSSANSINISRLIPQAAYYTYASLCGFDKLNHRGEHDQRGLSLSKPQIIISVPSGNFGNLTAGMYAKTMGAPIQSFIAATNINKTVPDYLQKGIYEPRKSQATISNAMDVGAPSNFERMKTQWTYEELKAMLTGVYVNDDETRQTIQEVHKRYGYFLDPHGAVGWKAIEKADKTNKNLLLATCYLLLETAHPAKFAETVEPITGPVPLPESLAKAMQREAHSLTIPNELSALKAAII
ncbi:MAG: threonine synthase [Spirochaetaceae bacterium]|jgi:threonine synthase|nr:threonine synthase [Spirochaetaceae bacterium]